MNGLVRERVEIARLVPRASTVLVISSALVNFALGVLPVVFVLATSVVLGRVPAAVGGGLHSASWHSLVAVFAIAAAAFVAQQFVAPGQAVAGLLALIARYTQLAGYVVAIGVAYSWLAAAGLMVAVLLFRYGQRGGLRKFAAVRFALAARERKTDYLRQLAIQPSAGKEIRIFGLDGWLREPSGTRRWPSSGQYGSSGGGSTCGPSYGSACGD